MKNQKIKDFWQSNYPLDKYIINNMSDATFQDVYNDIYNIYKIIGIYDSEIRCIIFEEIEKIYNIDYDIIYNRWLNK